MDNELITLCNDVTAHVDFLRNVGLSLTFSSISPVFAPVMPTLLRYEPHLPPVCAYLKAHKCVPGRCVENKAKLSAKKIEAPYYSCCWAGVEEYVFPVDVDGARVMLLNVSGYRSTLAKSVAMSKALSERLADPTYDELYAELSTTPPTLEYVRSAITPLTHLIISLYKRCIKTGASEDDSLYVKLLTLIHESFTFDCTCTTLSAKLAYSESYLRHLFREKSGTSVGQYIIDLRLTHARDLIESTNMNVADVASTSGFGDPNYFSSAFKKKFGSSPLAYRRTAR